MRTQAKHSVASLRLDLEYIRRKIPVEDVARKLGIEIFSGHRARCWEPEKHNHGDADPSVRFHLGKNRVRCFNCDPRGGMSNIDLVMSYQRCSFQQALVWLRERFPIPSRRGAPCGPRARPSPFFRVGLDEFDNVVQSGLWAELSGPEKAILPTLHAARNEDAIVRLSYGDIMRYSGVGSRSSVAEAIQGLERRHALVVIRGPRTGTVRPPNAYRLTLDSDEFYRAMQDARQRREQQRRSYTGKICVQ